MKIPTFLLACVFLGQAAQADDARLIKEILPRADEVAWQQIDWRVNLWKARKEAAKSGKPIYLWEMDGHPLGCT